MMNYLGEHNFLHINQSGFRQNYGTTPLLVGITDAIRKNLNDGKCNVLISLDLSKAFDRLPHSKLIIELCNRYKFSFTALINSYFFERIQFVSVGGSNSRSLAVTSGVPQGSVIGPLLFMLFLDDLLYIPDSNLVKIFSYADDIEILFSAKKNFRHFGSKHSILYGFDFNPDKTKAICFGFPSENLNVQLDGLHLNFVSDMKCLGIYVDENLCFKLK